MELLYFWINQSENKVFEKQEVLLTDKYNIYFDLNNLKVDISLNKSFYNLFKNNVVKNVSALVGVNGVGKTTLLKYLYSNDIMPKYEETRPEYQQAEELKYAEDKTLQVFEVEERIIIIHNLEQDVTASEGVEIIKMIDDVFIEMTDQKSYLNSITKVYLTNGNYNDENGYSLTKGESSKVVLSTNSLRTFSRNFYEKSIDFPQGFIEDTLYNGLQNMVISTKGDMDFQSICDIIYFSKLFDKNQIKSFSSKVSTELHISSTLLPIILNSMKTKMPTTYRSDIDYSNIVKQKIDLWSNFINKMKCDVHNLTDCLKLNLIFELDFINNVLSEELEFSSLDDTYNHFTENLKLFCEKRYCEYYNNGILEISELQKIIEQSNYISTPLPEKDMAYKRRTIIEYEKKPRQYLEFIKYINNIAMKKSSFIFKYIKFENLKMSSGERAYLNFFSWINLLSFFNKLSPQIATSAKENILILIDEIELYCHPEWQRKFISFLLEELTLQFPNKKIQIIFATHSPILLSDIPLSNTVYISKDIDGKSVIENRCNHQETFAANVYKLFNDSFFLKQKGAVGEYARESINSVFLNLKEVLENKKDKSDIDKGKIKFIINSVGEPIIKYKLNDMYWEVFPEDREDLIQIQSKQIKELEEIIMKGKILKDEELKTLSAQLKSTLYEINKLLPSEGDLK